MVVSGALSRSFKRIEKKKKMQMPLRDGQFQNGLVRTTKFNSSLALLEPAKILLMPGGCHGDSHFKPRSVMILN